MIGGTWQDTVPDETGPRNEFATRPTTSTQLIAWWWANDREGALADTPKELADWLHGS